MAHPLQEQAQRAAAALEALRAAALAESLGHPAIPPAAPDFVLAWHAGMAPEALAQAALEAAAEAVSATAAFRPGQAYCYRCRTATCAHAVPAAPGAVFAGYTSLGQPQWEEFLSFLLAAGERRTDLLYHERPEVLARLVSREQIVADQLVSFGRNSFTYHVWGEVVAGYFRLADSKAALTVQVVETATHALHLQLLAPPALRECLADTPPGQRSPLHRAFDALQEARRRIDALAPVWVRCRRHGPEARERLRRQALDVLRQFARSLERQGRQEHRRTQHAEARTADARPVHTAPDDLADATPADFYRDTLRGSVIVRGRSGRCHVFSDAGRHITTLTIGRDELDSRLRRRRYLPLPAAERAAFRKTLTEGHPA